MEVQNVKVHPTSNTDNPAFDKLKAQGRMATKKLMTAREFIRLNVKYGGREALKDINQLLEKEKQLSEELEKRQAGVIARYEKFLDDYEKFAFTFYNDGDASSKKKKHVGIFTRIADFFTNLDGYGGGSGATEDCKLKGILSLQNYMLLYFSSLFFIINYLR